MNIERRLSSLVLGDFELGVALAELAEGLTLFRYVHLSNTRTHIKICSLKSEWKDYIKAICVQSTDEGGYDYMTHHLSAAGHIRVKRSNWDISLGISLY